MEREITSNFHPAGANISYWVVVWDEYSELTKSTPYNYTIPGIVMFNYPFEYTLEDVNGNVDNSKWYPDSWTLLAMGGIGMLTIPLFAYLLTEERKKTKQAESLLIKEDKKEVLGGLKDDGSEVDSEIEIEKDEETEKAEEGF